VPTQNSQTTADRRPIAPTPLARAGGTLRVLRSMRSANSLRRNGFGRRRAGGWMRRCVRAAATRRSPI
jgi:hypothetical protein